MKDDQEKENKQSFITTARREQIIEATIKTLDEIGYVKASLAQIAKRAGISTALISYHFADKRDLMNHLLMKLIERSTTYILGRVEQEHTTQKKITTFIVASLDYQWTHPAVHTALIEIVFHARTVDNIPYYKLNDEDEDPMLNELHHILLTGQKDGIFGTFNVDVMANMIQGAIGEYMLNPSLTNKVDLETYGVELIRIVNQALNG